MDTLQNNASKIDDKNITQTIDILSAGNMSSINETKSETSEQNPNLMTNNLSETNGTLEDNSTQQSPNVINADILSNLSSEFESKVNASALNITDLNENSDVNNTNSTQRVDQPIGQTINQTTDPNNSGRDKPLEIVIPESDNLDFGPSITLSNMTDKNETIAESHNQTIAESQNQTITNVGNDENVTTIYPFIPTLFTSESDKTSNDTTNNQTSEESTQSPEQLQSTTIEDNSLLSELNSSLSSTNNETFLNSSTTTLTNQTETITQSVTLNSSIPEITTQSDVVLNETSDYSEPMATTESTVSTNKTPKPNTIEV